jgi:quinoprotein glucose dehydrogenase
MRTLLLILLAALSAAGQDYSEEALQSIRKLHVPPGLKVELFAAEPQFVNPVCMSIDEHGRVYVAETHRRHSAVLEVWDRRDWLDGDLASRTVEDRVALYRKHLGPAADKLGVDAERIRVLQDLGGKGHADFAVTFADGFNDLADGLGSSVLAHGNEVWYTCAPNLWHFTVGPDGKAIKKEVLATGFGVHLGSGAHDLHGLCRGPDGKIYFTMGDRGFHVVTKEGRTLDSPDCGAALRCNPDGSGLEVFATGLRNPEQLCFDAQGNLWTGDNNSDAGDKARWIWIVEGADYGWRFGYQREVLKTPWMIERLWTTEAAPSQAPVAGYVGHGPSGVACDPGSGLTDAFRGRFFMCDFPGSVRSFAVKPRGAGFEVVDDQAFLSELWPTDCKFGPDGALYVSDWVQGWAKPEKGRIFRVSKAGPDDLDTPHLLAQGMKGRSIKELHDLLDHKDFRVRLEAQFELVARKESFVLGAVAMCGEGPSQLHGIWGLGQLKDGVILAAVRNSPQDEVRAQVAKVQGDLGIVDGMTAALRDGSSRVRFFAALALGKAKAKDAVPPLLEMLRDNDDRDGMLRQAGVFAIASIGDIPALLTAAKDSSAAVRMASLLALRRLESAEGKRFLADADAAIVLEAARAIHDVPIPGAMEDLAALLERKALPERVAVRSVNAALRAGRSDLLVAHARSSESEATRVQALDALAEWTRLNPRDVVLGAWRPLLPRPAPDNLAAVFRDLSADSQPEAVRVHALRAWGELGLEASPLLSELLSKGPSAVRVEALRTMAKAKDPRAKEAITAAIDDADATLREEAVRLVVRFRLPDTAGLLEKLALATGALPVRQAAVASLGEWEGAEADGVLTRLLDRAKELPAGLHLELIEAAGKRSAAEVRGRLARFDAARTANTELLEGGDAKSGKEIFFERLDVSCVRCHTIKDRGGVVGPPLTKVGADRTREQILESIQFPNKVIVQGYGQVMLKLDNDVIEVGRVEKETETEMVLVQGDGAKKKILKADIRARKEGLSAMPEDISKSLSRRDLRDLVAYLSSLR